MSKNYFNLILKKEALDTVKPGYNKPFCTLANGPLYPGIRCKGRDFTGILQGGAHREGLLYPGVRCIGGLLYPGFTVLVSIIAARQGLCIQRKVFGAT